MMRVEEAALGYKPMGVIRREGPVLANSPAVVEAVRVITIREVEVSLKPPEVVVLAEWVRAVKPAVPADLAAVAAAVPVPMTRVESRIKEREVLAALAAVVAVVASIPVVRADSVVVAEEVIPAARVGLEQAMGLVAVLILR